jgi:hypothetical protein
MKLNHNLMIADILNNTEGLYEGTLWHYFNVLIQADSASNPYHNVRHPLHTTWLAYQACQFYKDKLSKRQIRSLLIAAMLHDVGHFGKGGTEVPDYQNIFEAISIIESVLLAEDVGDIHFINSLVWATEFPHKDSAEIGKITLPHKIIRDCDTAQVFGTVWIQQVLIGLSREWNITPIEMLRTQINFLNAIHFTTDWAQNVFPETVVLDKINETEQLLIGLESVSQP